MLHFFKNRLQIATPDFLLKTFGEFVFVRDAVIRRVHNEFDLEKFTSLFGV